MSASIKVQKAALTNRRPILYYITDRKQLDGASLLDCVQRVISQGVDYIQIREKDLPDRALYKLTCKVVKLASKTECKVLVNGRPDIAWAAGAAGVHLTSAGLKISEIRSWIPAKMIVGVSVHTIREAQRACAAGAHYLLLGHLFPTESKSALGKPVGLDYLRKLCATVPIPVLGLGGISPELVPSVLDAGAVGIAGIRIFQNRWSADGR